LIRHLAKLRSVPRNAQMVLDLRQEFGSMGNLIADWPAQDIVGLWRMLAKRGNQLGGPSVARLLRMLGRDTFVTTADVLAALVGMGVLGRPVATSQRDLATVQQAFNTLAGQSGRTLGQLSAKLAFTVTHRVTPDSCCVRSGLDVNLLTVQGIRVFSSGLGHASISSSAVYPGAGNAGRLCRSASDSLGCTCPGTAKPCTGDSIP